jgi:hypothetical protein
MCIFTEILVVLIVYILESYVMSMLPLISLKGGLSALFTFPILRVVCILLNIHVRFFKKKLAISRSVHGRTSFPRPDGGRFSSVSLPARPSGHSAYRKPDCNMTVPAFSSLLELEY